MNKLNKLLCRLSVNNCILSQDTNLVMPIESYDKQKYNTIHHRLGNKNNVFLVIDEMCLGIFLTRYEAGKLPFLDRIINNDTDLQTSNSFYHKNYCKFINSESDQTGCTLITISNDWEILPLWSQHKLVNIHSWIHYLSPISNIDTEYNVALKGAPQEIIDIEFVTTMGFAFT